MQDTLIIGHGLVGSHLHQEIQKVNPEVYDKYKEPYTVKKDKKYDFAFICVNTPYIDENNVCDISSVEEALVTNEADIYIIKSTILPGTTKKLAQKLNKKIVFSPEFWGATQHAENFNQPFTILGGDKKDCHEVAQLLQSIYDATHQIIFTDSTTAELDKYMVNSYLAMKVSFCNEFWEYCKYYGVDYNELRELFCMDIRINSAHTFVYDNKPYWDSHCFNKDVPAIATDAGGELLNFINEFNSKRKLIYSI